eukprot:m51a1_g7149 hypothetical protein (442) ;mRNA; r:326508-331760
MGKRQGQTVEFAHIEGSEAIELFLPWARAVWRTGSPLSAHLTDQIAAFRWEDRVLCEKSTLVEATDLRGFLVQKLGPQYAEAVIQRATAPQVGVNGIYYERDRSPELLLVKTSTPAAGVLSEYHKHLAVQTTAAAPAFVPPIGAFLVPGCEGRQVSCGVLVFPLLHAVTLRQFVAEKNSWGLSATALVRGLYSVAWAMLQLSSDIAVGALVTADFGGLGPDQILVSRAGAFHIVSLGLASVSGWGEHSYRVTMPPTRSGRSGGAETGESFPEVVDSVLALAQLCCALPTFFDLEDISDILAANVGPLSMVRDDSVVIKGSEWQRAHKVVGALAQTLYRSPLTDALCDLPLAVCPARASESWGSIRAVILTGPPAIVSCKADGIHVVLFASPSGLWFELQASGSVDSIPEITVPKGTVLDVEMVSLGEQGTVFLVFDVLAAL